MQRGRQAYEESEASLATDLWMEWEERSGNMPAREGEEMFCPVMQKLQKKWWCRSRLMKLKNPGWTHGFPCPAGINWRHLVTH